MIPKSGNRLSEKIMRDETCMIPKSGNRFSEQIMLHRTIWRGIRFLLRSLLPSHVVVGPSFRVDQNLRIKPWQK